MMKYRIQPYYGFPHCSLHIFRWCKQQVRLQHRERLKSGVHLGFGYWSIFDKYQLQHPVEFSAVFSEKDILYWYKLFDHILFAAKCLEHLLCWRKNHLYQRYRESCLTYQNKQNSILRLSKLFCLKHSVRFYNCFPKAFQLMKMV